MATTTSKSTKKKTASKATKKPAAKVVKTTRAAAKTTKKTATTKAVKAVKTPVTTGKSSNIKRLLIVSAFVSLLGAAVAGVFMDNSFYQIVSGLLAKNELAGADNAGFVPAVKHVYDLNLRWAVVGILSLGALFPLLFLTIYKNRFAAAAKAKVNALRWIDMAVVGALMLEVTALLSGVNDLATLKLISASILITCALGWIAEKRNVQAGRPVKSELWLSIVTGTLPWLVIACHAINTVITGRISAPWYVYALYAVLLPGFIGYALTLKGYVKGKLSYETAERNYVGLGILVKVAFAAILIAGSLTV